MRHGAQRNGTSSNAASGHCAAPPPSPHGDHQQQHHEAKRDRILLLNKKELKKLLTRGEEKGLTIVPLALFISERGFAKLEIGLAQGKKTFDKRETLKERDTKVEIDRAMKR